MLFRVHCGMLSSKGYFVCAKQQFACEEDVRVLGGRTSGDFYLAALRNFDDRDSAACLALNKELVLWFARGRLWTWYQRQGPVAMDREVNHYHVQEEVMQIHRPYRTFTNMFTWFLREQLRMAAVMGIEPHSRTPNGVHKDGTIEPVLPFGVARLETPVFYAASHYGQTVALYWGGGSLCLGAEIGIFQVVKQHDV